MSEWIRGQTALSLAVPRTIRHSPLLILVFYTNYILMTIYEFCTRYFNCYIYYKKIVLPFVIIESYFIMLTNIPGSVYGSDESRTVRVWRPYTISPTSVSRNSVCLFSRQSPMWKYRPTELTGWPSRWCRVTTRFYQYIRLTWLSLNFTSSLRHN